MEKPVRVDGNAGFMAFKNGTDLLISPEIHWLEDEISFSNGPCWGETGKR